LFKRTQKDINIISNLFLDFYIRLTWHHFSYRHIPIHYNREITNVIKFKIVLYSPFFVRLSFWVPWLWICAIKIMPKVNHLAIYKYKQRLCFCIPYFCCHQLLLWIRIVHNNWWMKLCKKNYKILSMHQFAISKTLNNV
jgi:hypothetical protein